MRPNLPDFARFLSKNSFRELPPLAMFALASIVLNTYVSQAAQNSARTAEPPAAKARLVDYVTGGFQVEPEQSRVTAMAPPARGEGRFTDVSGDFSLARPFSESTAHLTLSATSLETGNAKRDAELRALLTQGQQQPNLTINADSFEGTPSAFKLKADLTIKGVTKEVVFNGKIAKTDRAEGDRVIQHLDLQGAFDPKEFGLKYEAPGKVEVGKQVILKLLVAGSLRDQRDIKAQPPTK